MIENRPADPLRADGLQQQPARYVYLTVLLLIAATTLRLWYVAAGALDLAPDEAHYWEWSRRLDWSYYSKGPAVAYLIAAFTRCGSSTDFFVRLPAVLLSFGTGVLVYLLAHDLFASQRAGFLAVLACSANPLFAAGSILTTIDAPLGFFWSAAGFAAWKAVRSRVARARLAWWCVFGVALGLGVLSKYTMLLIVPCVGAYLLIAPAARRCLREPAPYVALSIACFLCIPVVVWNAQHDWVTLRHVGALAGLTSAATEDAAHFTAKTFFEFLGSQFGVVSPVLFVALVVAMITSGQRGLWERRDEYLFPCLLAAPPLAFFLLWSLYEKVEGNWAAPAYVTATVALAGLWNEQLARAPRVAVKRIVLVLLPGFLMVVLAHFPGLPRYVGLTLPPRVDLTRRLDGWKELGRAVGAVLQETRDENLFLFSEHYQIASELAFYVPGQPRVYNIDAGRRMNQYDIWGGLERLRGRDGLFVTYGDWSAPPPVQEACEALQKLQVVETSHLGQPGQTFSIFRCVRYKGLSSAPSRTAF
jgi:4-amino-4-deoxy-L-arabinose transferase-like glycosyltransferase